MKRPSSLAQIRALDGALAAPVLGDLRAQIIASRTLDAGTYWYALDAVPRLVVEQVIQQLRTHVPRGDEAVGAEWWFRATATDTGFPFHFDRDEGIRSKIISPDIASILYLSNGGGPTLVLDAAPTRTAAPTAAIGVPPRLGRFMMFPGALLHGVLAGPPNRWPRVTLLVNWWRSEPRLERAAQPFDGTRASDRRRVGARATSANRALLTIDPSRLMSRAAWLDIVAEQRTTYRR